MLIPLDQIIPNPEQPRKEFDPDELASLAESLVQHGQIQPIAVEDASTPAGPAYILLDGERRWRAARIANLPAIEAIVRPHMNGGGSQKRLELALVANIQRKDMSPVEEGRAMRRLRQMGKSIDEICQIVGLAKSNVMLRLNMLELDPGIQELFDRRKLPIHSQVVAALRNIPDENRLALARKFAQSGSTVGTIISVSRRVSNGAARPYASSKIACRSQALEVSAGHWDAIAQLSSPVPDDLAAIARQTCQACILYQDASYSACRDCPAVDLLRRLVSQKEAANGR